MSQIEELPPKSPELLLREDAMAIVRKALHDLLAITEKHHPVNVERGLIQKWEGSTSEAVRKLSAKVNTHTAEQSVMAIAVAWNAALENLRLKEECGEAPSLGRKRAIDFAEGFAVDKLTATTLG